MNNYLIAVPSNNPGGMDADLAGHFGHCDIFTLVNIEEGKISDVKTLPSVPHEQGGCMAPVNYLSGEGVNILVAGGMGMRPLMGFESVGINVYHYNGHTKISDIIEAFIDDKLPKFTSENTCGGGGGQ